jgi:hypothetical protein
MSHEAAIPVSLDLERSARFAAAHKGDTSIQAKHQERYLSLSVPNRLRAHLIGPKAARRASSLFDARLCLAEARDPGNRCRVFKKRRMSLLVRRPTPITSCLLLRYCRQGFNNGAYVPHPKLHAVHHIMISGSSSTTTMGLSCRVQDHRRALQSLLSGRLPRADRCDLALG